jgi:hypothetical protein
MEKELFITQMEEYIQEKLKTEKIMEWVRC